MAKNIAIGNSTVDEFVAKNIEIGLEYDQIYFVAENIALCNVQKEFVAKNIAIGHEYDQIYFVAENIAIGYVMCRRNLWQKISQLAM